MVALRDFGAIIRNGKAEINFSQDKIVVDGVPITGKIDHVIVNEVDKTIEIYDYKTAGYHKEKWESHASLYKYKLQLEFYKLLLKNSNKYAKYKVTKGHILFVIPDRDGEVYDKKYEFTPESEKGTIDLIKSVYNLVITLRFMDEPDIFIAPNSTLGVKDIKNFIELVLENNIIK